MKVLGVEIYEGKPITEVQLEVDKSLEEQALLLWEDIACIDYTIDGKYEVSIDIGWYSANHFRIVVREWTLTGGEYLFRECSKTIQDMQQDLKKASDLVQSLKGLTESELWEKVIKVDFAS